MNRKDRAKGCVRWTLLISEKHSFIEGLIVSGYGIYYSIFMDFHVIHIE